MPDWADVNRIPRRNGDVYIRHRSIIPVDVGQMFHESHEYIAWCFRVHNGEYGPLRTFDVPLNEIGDVDPQSADGEIVDLVASTEGSVSFDDEPFV